MQRVLRLAVVLIVLIQVGGEIRVCAMGGHLWNGKPAPLTAVLIGGNRIAVPLKRIILVRFDSSYCAVRFTKADWGKTEAESFSEYESWVQEDGRGDFSKLNVVYTRDDLWWKTPIGIGRMWLIKRDREEIRCGPVTLRWVIGSSIELVPWRMQVVYQMIHFAPTPWTSISEVNIRDPRIKWYNPRDHGPGTPDIRIPIDELWKQSR